MDPNGNKRLFIAIEVPINTICNALSVLENVDLRGLRFVNKENLHITIKFLGHTPNRLLETVISGIEESSTGIKPFELQIQGLGAFPNLAMPRILWMDIKRDIEPILYIRERLDSLLNLNGFKTEQRKFSPHLTVGRFNKNVSNGDLKMLDKCIWEISNLPVSCVKINSLNLIESTLTSHGPIYKIRHKETFDTT